mgnify:CR=1 FL=1
MAIFILPFDDDGAIKYLLSSHNVLSPKLFFTRQAGTSNIFLGEKVFSPSRAGVKSKSVCMKKNIDRELTVSNHCMTIEYGKVYEFFPGEYYLEETSTLPRAYHSKYELSLIDKGEGKLRLRSTKKAFTVQPKQKAKQVGAAPASLSR